MAIRVFFLALLLLASPFLQVARCQQSDESQSDFADDVDKGDHDIVADVVAENEATETYSDVVFAPAPGFETVCIFPKNSGKVVVAGEETELVVGIKYDGVTNVNVVEIKASVHLSFDHKLLVQNLTSMVLNSASVPPSSQASFSYLFAVSKFLQPGQFDLVGTIGYEIDQQPYQTTFYNGTIEVVESSGMLSIETVFLVTLGLSLVAALIFWLRVQIQNLKKKSKRTTKVEVGTRSVDASLDEWLEGTAYAQSQSNKSKKKK